MSKEPDFDDDLNVDSNDDGEVDYLHPNGKRATSHMRVSFPDYTDGTSYRKALEEADGHSILKYDPFIHDQKHLDYYATKARRNTKWTPLFSGPVNRWIVDADRL
jgi:hypothetical protein